MYSIAFENLLRKHRPSQEKESVSKKFSSTRRALFCDLCLFSTCCMPIWFVMSVDVMRVFGVAGWAEEAVAKAEILRLIYQGRFLHSNVTLGALGLPLGKTTVMHLVPRENLPEPNSQGTACPP